ncbi:hypothetical protein ACS0TY_000267 [Phlomoides rotata]
MGRSRTATKRRKLNLSRMGEKRIEVIEIDDSSPSPKSKVTPIRSTFCLRNRDDIQKYEEEEDCFILEFDPYNDIDIKSTSGKGDDVDLHVVAEKGQVACRDYPHPRNTCVKYPFEKTSHDRHCELCFCYVCDSSAPCKMWTGGGGHCHAFNNEAWNVQRRSCREKNPSQSNNVR